MAMEQDETVSISISLGSSGMAKYEGLEGLTNQRKDVKVEMSWEEALDQVFQVKVDPQLYSVQRPRSRVKGADPMPKHDLREPVSVLIQEFSRKSGSAFKVCIVSNQPTRGKRFSIGGGGGEQAEVVEPNKPEEEGTGDKKSVKELFQKKRKSPRKKRKSNPSAIKKVVRKPKKMRVEEELEPPPAEDNEEEPSENEVGTDEEANVEIEEDQSTSSAQKTKKNVLSRKPRTSSMVAEASVRKIKVGKRKKQMKENHEPETELQKEEEEEQPPHLEAQLPTQPPQPQPIVRGKAKVGKRAKKAVASMAKARISTSGIATQRLLRKLQGAEASSPAAQSTRQEEIQIPVRREGHSGQTSTPAPASAGKKRPAQHQQATLQKKRLMTEQIVGGSGALALVSKRAGVRPSSTNNTNASPARLPSTSIASSGARPSIIPSRPIRIPTPGRRQPIENGQWVDDDDDEECASVVTVDSQVDDLREMGIPFEEVKPMFARKALENYTNSQLLMAREELRKLRDRQDSRFSRWVMACPLTTSVIRDLLGV